MGHILWISQKRGTYEVMDKNNIKIKRIKNADKTATGVRFSCNIIKKRITSHMSVIYQLSHFNPTQIVLKFLILATGDVKKLQK